MALPRYYRNKLYTEEQREQLWINLLDKQIMYVRGEEIDISTPEGYSEYEQALTYRQKENITLGYSSDPWSKKKYKKMRKKFGI